MRNSNFLTSRRLAGVFLAFIAWTATGQPLRTIDFEQYPVSAIAIDSQGNSVVAGTYPYRQCGVVGRAPYSCYHVFVSSLRANLPGSYC